MKDKFSKRGDIWTRFRELMEPILVKKNLGKQRVGYRKFWECEKIYSASVPLIRTVLDIPDLRRGLDFGCGGGGLTALGEVCGLDMVGLDILMEIGREGSPVPCSFIGIHEAMREVGLSVVNMNTNLFPWAQFADDEFDFIVARRALYKQETYAPEEWDGEEKKKDQDNALMKRRMKEVARIVRPGGKLVVFPKKQAVWARSSKAFKGKDIEVLWP